MISRYWNLVRDWCGDAVRSSAIKRLSETVEGKLIRKMLAPILCYILVSAILTGQLLLQQWPESFSAFLLGSPAIACAILSVLAIACKPDIAAQVPLYACGGFIFLAALQCIMGAFATCLPSPPNRVVFALITGILVTCLCFGLSKAFVDDGIEALHKTKIRASNAAEATKGALLDRIDDEDGSGGEDDNETFTDASSK